jgi:hypothetical protein
VHLDICPWTYLPDAKGGSRRHDIETNPDLLRYDGDTRIRQLKDWRAEINCVRGEYGPHSQGVLALTDNEAQDGGTVVVPGFHRVFREWQAALGTWEGNRVGQRRRGCSYNFHDPRDPIHGLARRVPVRAGSLLLWNQCTVHGAVPNMSTRFRVAQFVRGVRAGECGVGEGGMSERAAARARAVVRELQAAGAGAGGERGGGGPELLALAPHVFGVTPEDVLLDPPCAAASASASFATATATASPATATVSADGDGCTEMVSDSTSDQTGGGGLVDKYWNI